LLVIRQNYETGERSSGISYRFRVRIGRSQLSEKHDRRPRDAAVRTKTGGRKRAEPARATKGDPRVFSGFPEDARGWGLGGAWRRA
jgi:hypothetical protein